MWIRDSDGPGTYQGRECQHGRDNNHDYDHRLYRSSHSFTSMFYCFIDLLVSQCLSDGQSGCCLGRGEGGYCRARDGDAQPNQHSRR